MPDRRKSVFTTDDIEQISELIKTRANHICRFDGVDPADLKSIISSVHKFEEIMADNRAIVRRFVIRLALITISGLTVYGFWGKLVKTFKDAS